MTAYRMMQLHPDATIRSDWLPSEALDDGGVFTARCEHDHQPPRSDCSCGVYVTTTAAPLAEWIGENEHREFWSWLVIVEGHLDGPVLPDPSMPTWPTTDVPCLRGAAFTATAVRADPRAHRLASQAAHRYNIPLESL